MENQSLAELMEMIGTRVGHVQMYKLNGKKTLAKNVVSGAAVDVHSENGWVEYVPKAQPVESKRFVPPVVPKINTEPFKVPVPKELTEKIEDGNKNVEGDIKTPVPIKVVEEKKEAPKVIPPSGTSKRRGRGKTKKNF